jgi:hypothetical protein
VTDPSLSILDIRADHVTIDLNGFSILGPQVCDVGNCVSTGLGNAIGSFNVAPFPVNTTVVNGTISGFNGCVVLFAVGVHVQRLAISHCTVAAILVGDHGLVLDNRVANVRNTGINMGANTAFRDNVVTDADLGASGTSFAFEGGRAVGGDVCEDRSCSRVPKRRAYLTPGDVPGNQALSACAPGFHMASRWELHDLGSLEYDSSLGRTQPDSGSGFPSSVSGWIRSGGPSSIDENCSLWTWAGSGQAGRSIFLPSAGFSASTPTVVASPWSYNITLPCTGAPVWCVED